MKMNFKRFAILAAAALAAVSGLFASCAAPQATATPQASKTNKPPVITNITGVESWTPTTDGEFQCVASDPDGDTLSYSWLADNGTLVGEGNTVNWTAPASMGTYHITATVNDGHGGEAKLVKTVKVLLNIDGSITPDVVVLKMSLPSSEVVTGAKRLRVWTAVGAECQVEGANASDLKFSWTASDGKLQGQGLKEGKASKVTWIAPSAGGDYTLDVVVSDGQGNQAKGKVTFTVFCCGN